MGGRHRRGYPPFGNFWDPTVLLLSYAIQVWYIIQNTSFQPSFFWQGASFQEAIFLGAFCRGAYFQTPLYVTWFLPSLPAIIIWMFVKILWGQNFFYGGVKIIWGGVILLHFHYLHCFISLETAKHPENWSLSFKNFFRNVNASGVVTCQYPQTY